MLLTKICHSPPMASFNLPSHLAAITPVVITSPTTRCGTTLMQRLFCSGANSICYGEDMGLAMSMMGNVLNNMLATLPPLKDELNSQRDAVIKGDTGSWTPNLMPDVDGYLNCWIEMYYKVPNFLQQYSASVDRPVWAIKYPGMEIETILSVRSYFPNSKVIYIFRHVEQALMSAKARQFVTTTEEAGGFCLQWRENLLSVSEHVADDNILFVKYEDMIAQPREHIAMFEAFTGAQGLQESVFATKVNTFAGDEDEGRSGDQYITPEAISDEEREMMDALAGPALAQLYKTEDAAQTTLQ